MTDSCLNCGGLILEPNKIYGYAGPVCQCPKNPAHMYQRPASQDKPLLHGEYEGEPDVSGWVEGRGLPHKLICHDCAIERGGVLPSSHTVSLGVCPYCKMEKYTSVITDYKWPEEMKVKYVWD